VKAASAISRMADDKFNPKLEKLKPLVFGEVAVDPNDELKGCALRVLWPNLLTLEELFEVLTPPKANLYGVYRSFISGTLRNHNWGNDIRHALKWVMTQVEKGTGENAWQECYFRMLHCSPNFRRSLIDKFHYFDILENICVLCLESMQCMETVLN
jgi:hypothetical protein